MREPILKNRSMVNVEKAEKIILSQVRDFGAEKIPFESALGRVLAEDLRADRDLPPFDRVTMDGIAIRFEAFQKGIRSFRVKATQAAGEPPVDIVQDDECIEIMTGAVLPGTTDTVIRYEDIDVKDGLAVVKEVPVKKGQSRHPRGKDRKQQEVVAAASQFVTPALISMAASIGKTELSVRKLPRIVIISSGDELVEVNEPPSPWQIRRSNNYTIRAVLQRYALQADMLHIPDDPGIIRRQLEDCLKKYDAILISGGVSKGKFDYVPETLQDLSVARLFHKVRQKPGKPFWFGSHPDGQLIFAFPGNPVSTFMCLHRYFLPWLKASEGVMPGRNLYARLNEDVAFSAPLQYFLQVTLQVDEEGCLLATPAEGNGSGDFANLVVADAFMELPLEQQHFNKGEVYRIWPFNR